MIERLRDLLAQRFELNIKQGRKRSAFAIKVTIKPKLSLVYGIIFAIIALFGLLATQIIHMLIFQEWRSEIWTMITVLIMSVISVLFGIRGLAIDTVEQ